MNKSITKRGGKILKRLCCLDEIINSTISEIIRNDGCCVDDLDLNMLTDPSAHNLKHT